MLTLQEIYDKGYRHVMRQGCPSIQVHRTGSSCVYRDGKGHACVVGGCFADEDYDPGMDKPGVTVTQMRLEHRGTFALLAQALLNQGIDVEQPRVVDLLTSMQECHDQAALAGNPADAQFLPYFKRNMTAVAAQYALSVPVLEEAIAEDEQ